MPNAQGTVSNSNALLWEVQQLTRADTWIGGAQSVASLWYWMRDEQVEAQNIACLWARNEPEYVFVCAA